METQEKASNSTQENKDTNLKDTVVDAIKDKDLFKSIIDALSHPLVLIVAILGLVYWFTKSKQAAKDSEAEKKMDEIKKAVKKFKKSERQSEEQLKKETQNPETSIPPYTYGRSYKRDYVN